MKKLVRCGRYSECAVYRGCGFTAQPTYICTKFSEQTTKEDGCTFGCRGENQVAVTPYDIELNIKQSLLNPFDF